MTADDRRLITEALDGTPDEASRADFNRRIAGDPAFREAYREQSETHGMLMWRLSRARSKVDPDFAPPRRIRFPLSLHIATAACFGVATLAGSAYFWRMRPAGSPAAIGTAETGSVARVISERGMAVAAGETPLAVGRTLRPGKYRLASGRIAVAFDSGAVVNLEGPAEFEPVDAFHALLHRGKATAVVGEQAVGFKLRTPSATVEDMGTEFAVNVSEAGSTEVKVIDGVVSLATRRGLLRLLGVNRAVHVSSRDNSVRDIDPVKIAVAAILPPGQGKPPHFIRWSFDEAEISGDSGVHTGPRFALRTAGGASGGSGAVKGRIGGGWYFDGSGSTLVSDYPGLAGNAPRTVAFWIRIPTDVTIANAYAFLAWGVPSKTSEKWQIGWNPNLIKNEGAPGAIRSEFGNGYVIGSTDLRDGRWHHVVSVFLGGDSPDVAKAVRHYIDGHLEPVSGFKPQKVATGTVATHRNAVSTRMGGYLDGAVNPKFKGLKGTMDEVYIFDAALTPQQIYDLYRDNRTPEVAVPVNP